MPVPKDLLAVGRVSGTYGIRGWIRVDPVSAPPESVLLGVRRWWLQPASAAAAAEPGLVAQARARQAQTLTPRCLDIERVRVHADALVAKPVGIENPEAAARLKGELVLVSRADFPPGEEGEFYWADLIGCSVVNPAGEALGEVFAVEDHGAHPVLRLSQPGAAERMIPFVAAFILQVDLAGRRILADWQSDY
ncbi:MAG: ribosome maturation factor RimM [Betaproteobacteria bacterium]|nr:ribosome maturation factor RimM [Betaproteobacteria bacterium]